MAAIRYLGKKTVGYTVGNILRRLVGFLLIPLYTSVLTVTEFGELETLRTIYDALAILVNFGMGAALIRFYTECESEEEVGLLMRTSSVIVFVLSFALLGLFLPFGDDVSRLLFKDEALNRLIALSFLWAIGAALNQQLFAYYRARQDTQTYVIFSVGLFIVLVVLNIYFVRFLNMGVQGVLWGNLIPLWAVNLLVAARFWRRSWRLSWRWARTLLEFGLPFILAGFGWLILNSSDRYFLAYYRDLAEVGMYGLGYRAGYIMQIAIVLPFNLAWAPFVFSRYTENKEKALQDFSRVLTYILSVFSIFGLTLFLFAPELVGFLGSGKFAGAASVVPFVLLSSVFSGIYYWSAAFYHLKKKTGLLSVIVIAMAVMNLLLNWLLIPRWGWLGAGIATVTSISSTGLVTMAIGVRFYSVTLQRTRLAKLLISTGIIALLSVLITLPAGLAGWLLRGSLLLALPLLLFVAGFFDAAELKFIRTLPVRLISGVQWAIGHHDH